MQQYCELRSQPFPLFKSDLKHALLEAGPALQELEFLQDSGLELLAQQTLLLPVHPDWNSEGVLFNPQVLVENAVFEVSERQAVFC